MKVLLIGSTLHSWGGIERYISYLAEGLIGRGHEVHITAPPGSPLAKNSPGIIHELGFRKQMDFRAFFAYRKFFEAKQFDIAHAHFSPDYLFPSLAARKSCRAVIATRHLAIPWKPFKARTYNRIFDHFVGVSDAVERCLVSDSGIPAEKVSVAKAGCPEHPQTLVPNEPASKLQVGFFGRLAPEKGCDALLIAARGLEDHAEFHFFGEGPMRTELEQNAPENVRFHGFVPDVLEHMAQMDVIAIPSKWAEAFPFSALEAMAAGKPIIASNVGGLPELIADGVNGFLCAPNVPEEFCSATFEFVHHPEKRRQFGDANLKLHRNEYTIPHFAQRMEAVYEQVLSKRIGNQNEK